MDFASKGISWAENIFHKCEDIYRDGIMVKEPGKIVDAVGEQLRKIYDEVADDLLNPFSFTEDSASRYELPADDHRKSTSDDAGRPSDDDPSSSSSLDASSGGQSVAERSVFVRDDGLTLAKVNAEEIMGCSSALTLTSVESSGQAPAAEVLQSADPNISESNYLIPPLEKEEDYSEHGGQEENGRDEEFDDVGLEDFLEREKHAEELEEADSCELALISQRAMKNHSYKKKLRDVLASNFSSARRKWAGSRLGVRGASAASAPGVYTAGGLSPCESDWELV